MSHEYFISCFQDHQVPLQHFLS
uniref:Uncharacterized protein n=1 Tax=Rhizophora mucronata TaxID=61149 RepID=A0A2P2Q7B5_RHIMU